MAIRVRHETLADVGQVGLAAGQMQGAAQAAQQDEARAKFLLSLNENQRQFDVNTGLRVRDQNFDQQRYANQLAVTEANQQRQAYDREQTRAANYARDQMQNEYGLLEQQMSQQADWQTQAAKSADEQVIDLLKQANGMKLTPEGQRLRNEWAGQLRAVQSQRPTLRPEQYNAVLGQAMSRFNQIGLDAYSEHEPTPEEEVFGGMVPLNGQKIVPGQPLPPGKYRSVKGVRNGVKQYETIDIPHEEEPLTTADRFKRDMVPTPDGGFAIWNGEKKSWDYQAPAKKEAEKSEPKEPVLSARDKVAMRKAINDELFQEWEANQVETMSKDKEGKPVGTGEYTSADGSKTFAEYKQKHFANKIAEWNRSFGDPVEDDLTPSELRSPPDLGMPEMEGDDPEQVETREIITNAAGERAYVNPDGTVEMID